MIEYIYIPICKILVKKPLKLEVFNAVFEKFLRTI